MTRFTRTYAESETRARQKKWKKAPLGREIAHLATARTDFVELLTPILGRDLLERAVYAYEQAMHESACRTPVGERQAVAWKVDKQHRHANRNTDPGLRRFLALLCILLQWMHVDSRVTCGRRTWLGRAVDGKGEYVPKGKQGGLADALDTVVRTLERYEAILEAAGLYAIHQPRKKGGLAPDELPGWMRGAKYAYNLCRLRVDVPQGLQERLTAWYRKHKKVEPPKAPTQPSASRGAPAPILPADDALAASDQARQWFRQRMGLT